MLCKDLSRILKVFDPKLAAYLRPPEVLLVSQEILVNSEINFKSKSRNYQ